MTQIINSRILWVTLTIVIFFGSQFIYKKTRFPLCNPVLITISALIVLIKLTGVSYATYFDGGQLISFFLAPAVVALGVPLYLELEQIRKDGYALDREENVPGLFCVAVPIFDRFGQVHYGLSVSGPTVRMTGEKVQQTIRLLKEAGAEISQRLGYRG